MSPVPLVLWVWRWMGMLTLSFSRRREFHAGTVKMPPFDYTGGMRMSLLELCESLPTRCFADHAL